MHYHLVVLNVDTIIQLVPPSVTTADLLLLEEKDMVATMASSLVKLKKYDAPLDSLDRAFQINPKNKEVLVLKGLLLQNVMHRYDESLKCYDAVLTMDPHDTEVINYKQALLNMKTNLIGINWNEVINKKVYCIGKHDLGIVHSVETDHIVTARGIVIKDKFYLPKILVERYD